MFNWFNLLSVNETTDLIRGALSPLKDFLPEWIVFSLPDGLWVYSFSSSLLIIWRDNFGTAKLWLLFPFLLGHSRKFYNTSRLYPGHLI